jgi:hypothetical protein
MANPETDRPDSAPGSSPQPGDLEFLSSRQTAEHKSLLPWIIAAAAVLIGLALLLTFDRSAPAPAGTGTTGMAPLDPYAPNLPISGLQMSEATSFSGAKVTYIDGQIANHGSQTVTAITVQVGFRNSLGQFAQRTAMPLFFIRTREPYVDTEPVSAAPLAPGGQKDFRLIFDSLPDDWDQQAPEIRILGVRGHN